MKQLVLFVFIVLFNILPLTVHAPQERANSLEELFREKFTNWDNMDNETQETLRTMYFNSKNKYLWFPELHQAPERGRATIYPRNYVTDKINYILSNNHEI